MQMWFPMCSYTGIGIWASYYWLWLSCFLAPLCPIPFATPRVATRVTGSGHRDGQQGEGTWKPWNFPLEKGNFLPTKIKILIVAFISPGGWGFRFCRHKSKNIGGVALQNQKHVIWTWTSSIYKILTCNPTWAYTCHPLQIYKIQIIEIHLLCKGIKNWFTKPLKIVSENNFIL